MRSASRLNESSSGPSAISGRTRISSQLFYGLPIKESSGTRAIIAGSRMKDGPVSETVSSNPERLRSTKPSKRLQRLRSKQYRTAAAKANLGSRIAIQIRLLREAAGMSQAQLAKKIGTRQSAIARIEDPTYGKQSLALLERIAKEFDVAAWVELVSFSTYLRRTSDLSPKALTPKAYTEEFDASSGEPLSSLTLQFDGSPISMLHYATPLNPSPCYIHTD